MNCPGIVFHTSVAPHVQQSVRAFEDQGKLAGFFTTLYAGEFPLGPWIHSLPSSWTERLRQRQVPGLPRERVHCLRRWELLRLSAPGPASWRESLADHIWERGELAFSQWVSRRLPDPCGFVFGCDHLSLEVFHEARKRGIRRVLEISSLEWDSTQAITRTEMERMGLGRDPYLRLCEQNQPRRSRRCRAEWDLADVIIVNSEVTRASFSRAGFAVDKVRVLPLGAPPPVDEARQAWTAPDRGTLRLIWVGPFTPRKGVRILKQAMASASWPTGVSLDVYGSLPMPDVARGFPSSVRWHGPRPHHQIIDALDRADALILPTLADGFGMAITEAWSRGLPVLTTDQAGAAEWMEPGLHGCRFQAGQPDALTDAVAGFISRQDHWKDYRSACLALAKQLSWEQYRKQLPRVIPPDPSFA
jgi:glycosyltransferase involved in cell wall biosynthesis